MLTEKYNMPGDHAMIFEGKIGPLEGILSVPSQSLTPYVVILGHPHSLQGGTMNNKVVTSLARVFKTLGVPSIRFNFRGVGGSAGHYDSGIGESEDMLNIAEAWQAIKPNAQYIFAGFSFGSYVAYRAAAQKKHALLISIAPPVHHYDYHEFSPAPKPWFIVQGDQDDVVPLERVLEFASNHNPPLLVLRFPEAGHFFHGQLVALKHQLIAAIHATVSDL